MRQPCEVRCIGVVFRVPSLKVIQPVCATVVRRLPQNAVGSIVLDFPGFVPISKAEYFFGALIVVEIVLPKECRIASVVMENHHRETVNALPHLGVCFLIGRFIRAGIIV